MKNPKKYKFPVHLLWEYNLSTFDFEKSKKVVIERIIERGRLEDWQWMVNRYGGITILEVSGKSKGLSNRDKHFTQLFLNSTLLHELV